MQTLKFKCTLLSDVILNQKAATEGPNQTLDFIPGSCFLGIVASELYPKDEEINKDDYCQKEQKAWEIFHSGKVRFGDAHPSSGDKRGLRIPASMFYPKLKKPSDGELYIHHAIPDMDDKELKKKQLKQCRSGFYVFDDDKATPVKTETSFAIKSAYDKEKRRSKDEQMYGYESLQKGLELYFEVEIENDVLEGEIKRALIGTRRVGRSRTAQYGLVTIEEFAYSEVDSAKVEKDILTLYADSRLIFWDEYGLPTFRPTETQLELPQGAEILWDKSQIRTFQYAPWNYKRQCFDTDRCGIEKGSVIVVDVSKCDVLPEFKSHYIGAYNNEGFGKVIYNPEFLKANVDGLAVCRIEEKPKQTKPEAMELAGSALLQYVSAKRDEQECDTKVYRMVNEWVTKNKSLFQGKEKFASQWGAIRGIAMSTKGNSSIGQNVQAYISHGVKSSDWEGVRKAKLEEFIKQCDVSFIREALINLAAEMAKKCKEDIQ